MSLRPRVLALGAIAVLCAALAGCGIQMPSDPGGTLDRITGGELRAGASPAGDLVVVDGDDVTGPLPELVEAFAAERDATVVWTVASEEDLVDGLEAGDLDLAIGGMTDQTPWVDRASVTRGYPSIPGAHGASVVFLLPLGENATQAALETYLDEAVGQ